MSLEAKICTFRVISVLLLFVPLHGVTVKPVRCPTNKIAPHNKRSPYYGHGRNGARTFGAPIYDLLGPGQQHDHGLQERPQQDDPDDCGDIEDYDETDLSSLTQPYTQQGSNDNRFFFGPWLKPGQHQTTTRAPTTRPPTFKPQPAPPYWSGGYFSNNHYRPPVHHEPSDYLKPVHEGAHESQPTYRPDIVGGPLGHVVGARPVRPSTRPAPHYTTQRTSHHTRFPPRTVKPTQHTTRPARPRMLSNDGILGSFIDLILFK